MMLFYFLMFQFVFIFPDMTGWRTAYSIGGAGFMCFFIVYDTQVMLGGKHKYAISVDEHIFAALNLYLDIINLLLYILQILGGSKRGWSMGSNSLVKCTPFSVGSNVVDVAVGYISNLDDYAF